jgi:hypothetical protein
MNEWMVVVSSEHLVAEMDSVLNVNCRQCFVVASGLVFEANGGVDKVGGSPQE